MRIVEEIRSELKDMEKQEVYRFIFSLLSRQKSMFDRIASINQWEGSDIISEIYDRVERNVYVSQNLIYECGMDRADIEYLGWETEEIYMQIVNIFLDNLFGFVNQLQNKNDIDYAFSQCNFDLLENVIINEYGWKNVNEEMFCSNEYVQLEYAREKRDLERIQKGEYVHDSREMLIQIK